MSLLTPVRYPVKYYKWDDDQAPQLTDADGVIKTILKACLVTGYGDKAGAGWAARFEDDSRIVLRRPLQIGNPPDIKIENGVVNGQGSHRIVLQNNPSGLDDANELTVAGIITRDKNAKPEWHLIATDFAFIFFYKMCASNNNLCNTLLYIGGAFSLKQSEQEVFIVTDHNSNQKTGQEISWNYPFLSDSGRYKGIDGKTYSGSRSKQYHTLANSDDISHVIQPIIFNHVSAVLPVYCELTSINRIINTAVGTELQVMARPMLRISNHSLVDRGTPPFYTPLDYWEL